MLSGLKGHGFYAQLGQIDRDRTSVYERDRAADALA